MLNQWVQLGSRFFPSDLRQTRHPQSLRSVHLHSFGYRVLPSCLLLPSAVADRNHQVEEARLCCPGGSVILVIRRLGVRSCHVTALICRAGGLLFCGSLWGFAWTCQPPFHWRKLRALVRHINTHLLLAVVSQFMLVLFGICEQLWRATSHVLIARIFASVSHPVARNLGLHRRYVVSGRGSNRKLTFHVDSYAFYAASAVGLSLCYM